MFKAISILTAFGLGLSSLSLASTPARAGGEGVAAGIIGFAAGAIVGSQLNKNQKRTTRTYRQRAPRRTSEQRQYWMSIQDALNKAGYPAGPVDGAPGRKTRAAIRNFQLSIPAEPTGKLTAEQTQLLFARVNPQPVMLPANTHQPATHTFPNVTLPGNGAAATVQPVISPSGQTVTFPSPVVTQDAPAQPAPAVIPQPSFPAVQQPVATAAAPGVSSDGQAVLFPSANTDQQTEQLPAPVPAMTFPAVEKEEPETKVAATAPNAVSFPAVQPDALAGEETVPAGSAAASELPDDAASPQSVQPQSAAPQQAQIQIDENGQPFILVNGQKFLLQAAQPTGN